MNTEENIAHWNSRASLGNEAGTRDVLLKQLEQRAILAALPANPYADVLEVGCGTGETARLVSARLRVIMDAIDSSPEMIAQAKSGPGCDVFFDVGDVMAIKPDAYDVIYSQRCLINLSSWEEQKQTIDHSIAMRLKPGGRFLMCEHSQGGLDYINQIRQSWNRPKIERPWHNIYFKDSDLATITSLKLVECVPFSATYYFLSRILNDKLAEAEGLQPAYDAKINQLALRLQADCVDPRFAQGRLWIWEKA